MATSTRLSPGRSNASLQCSHPPLAWSLAHNERLAARLSLLQLYLPALGLVTGVGLLAESAKGTSKRRNAKK